MPPDDPDAAYLWDMWDAARMVGEFTRGKTFEAYRADAQLIAAVERKVEIIGEAARNVSRQFQQAHPEIPWRAIVAQRHVLAHEYGEIRSDRMWRVVTVHIPRLMGIIEPLLPPPPDSADEN